MVDNVLRWAERNERHLGAVLFVVGFIGDLLTFSLLSITLVNYLFLGYLAVAALCTLLGHYMASREPQVPSRWYLGLKVLFPLGSQYAIGSLLSGCLIYYTKSAFLAVSWPFLAILLAVFFGNEVFRQYKNRLAFQAVLFFFTLYAYLIFALPLYVHTISLEVFLASTALGVAIFGIFLLVLGGMGWQRLRESIRAIVLASGAAVVLIVGSYLFGILPPIPLTLAEAGIYHQVSRTGTGYSVEAEQVSRFHFGRHMVHVAPGETLYAFSSVFAPIAFSTSIVHEWDYYDPALKAWVSTGTIDFPVSGGRMGGYRGYSAKSDLAPGLWRVSIQTEEGRVIGRTEFRVQEVSTPVALHVEMH